MSRYYRNLPHWHPENEVIFVTWRLFGSLPRGTGTLACGLMSAGKRFVLIDRALDAASTGPMWLKNPQIAQQVVFAIHRGESELSQYALHAFVVMSNHVHLLISPFIPLARITKGIKGVSARAANQILQRAGKAFWQDESFDHWVRSEAEFTRIAAYIENNPVSAGLVSRAGEWRWSSAFKRNQTQARVPVPQGIQIHA